MKWALIHYVRTFDVEQHIPKIYITDVPENISAGQIRQAITHAGRQPSEHGIHWANHYLAPESEWPGDVDRLRDDAATPVITWGALTEQEHQERRITVRVSPALHRELLAVAERQGKSLQGVCLAALEAIIKS